MQNSDLNSSDGDLISDTDVENNDMGITKSYRTSSLQTTAGKRFFTNLGWHEGFSRQWDGLPERDRWALIILALFLLIVGGGYGGYMVYNYANQQKANYNTAVEEYFWLRGQAGNLDPKQAQTSLTQLNQQVTQLLANSGVSDSQVLVVGEKIQLSFVHNNQTMVSNILGQITSAGLTIQQLGVIQDPTIKQLRVQATVGR